MPSDVPFSRPAQQHELPALPYPPAPVYGVFHDGLWSQQVYPSAESAHAAVLALGLGAPSDRLEVHQLAPVYAAQRAHELTLEAIQHQIRQWHSEAAFATRNLSYFNPDPEALERSARVGARCTTNIGRLRLMRAAVERGETPVWPELI